MSPLEEDLLPLLAHDGARHGPIGDFERQTGLVEEHPPGIRELNASPIADEQLDTDGALELLDLLRQTRLGDAESLRRSAEMKLLGDGDEVPELTELYVCGHCLNRLRRPPLSATFVHHPLVWMKVLSTDACHMT